MAKKFLKQYEILLIKAKEDLVASKYLLDGFNHHNLELKLEIVFFHFQQCAEKLIKTILDFNTIKFPHSHDIEDLIKLVRLNNIIIISNIDELVSLSEYAVEGRYAIIHDDLDDADKYIKILDELLEFVEKDIKR
ncbi:MAG: HEPN domain-containing protein [Sulfurimonas sp.]|nr:HEPN domain-containing protein [Sulfurimonas sp.]